MKKIPVIICLLWFPACVFSQENSLASFQSSKIKIDRSALRVLGAYSIANVIYGSIAAASSEGSSKYFHQMNAIWNGVTLGITGIGHLARKDHRGSSLSETILQQERTEKLFLFNSGLDIAYIAGGAYIYERSKNVSARPERLKGYGQSVMLQGAVLLLFDGIVYAIHNKHGRQLHQLLQKLELGTTSNGVGITLKL